MRKFHLILWAALSLAAFLFLPSPAFACHQTQISFPADGANLNFDSLPGFITARYDTSLGGVYSLELYEGVPGNSKAIAGAFQQQNSCRDDWTEQNPFRLDRPGDYFFLLANVSQVESFGGFASWISHWESGSAFPVENIGHAVSRFSVNKEPEPETIDPVIIIPGILGSSDKNGVWVIDPIFHTYDDLIETLKANGYQEGKDLFTMPYDWRQSNVLTALQLRDEINKVQNICNCAKVDLVAHSMGGLVARQYIQSDKYENDVDQLIFLGTPHLGVPDAYLMWEGADFGPTFLDAVFEFLYSKEATKVGFSNLFDYMRNKPIISVQELLPVYDYIFDFSILRNYPNNYPRNIFIENLETTIGLLSSSGIQLTNIVGDAGPSATNVSINVEPTDLPPMWEHGKPASLNFWSGDNRVPYNSASRINADLNSILSDHIALPTKSEGLIFKKLTGKESAVLIEKIHIPSGRLILIQILSPVDVLITAPDGKKIGKDFLTGQEINQIEGAFYSGFLTDNEYITIPNPLDGQYKIEVQGTGTGSYTVATGYITDEVSIENDFRGETATGTISDLNISVNNSAPSEIKFIITLEDVIADIEMAYSQGWITKRSTKDNLIRDLKKNHMKNFNARLEREHPRNINDQAYNLLKEDINWLLKI